MRERLVGLRHLVHVVALLDDVALALERVDDLGSDGGKCPWDPMDTNDSATNSLLPNIFPHDICGARFISHPSERGLSPNRPK